METQVFRDPDDKVIGSAVLLQLLRYWRGLLRDGRLPARSDLAPSDMIPLLPWLMLIDILGSGQYRYRLVGTGIVEHVGFDATGMDVEKAYRGGNWPEIAKDYTYVVTQRRPCLTITSVFLKRDDPVPLTYRRLLLPLARDGTNPDMLVGAIQFSD